MLKATEVQTKACPPAVLHISCSGWRPSAGFRWKLLMELPGRAASWPRIWEQQTRLGGNDLAGPAAWRSGGWGEAMCHCGDADLRIRGGTSARPCSTATTAGTALLVPRTSPQPPFSSSLHSPFAADFTDLEKQSLAQPPCVTACDGTPPALSLSCIYHSVCFLASLPVFLLLHLCHTLSLPHLRQSSLLSLLLRLSLFPPAVVLSGVFLWLLFSVSLELSLSCYFPLAVAFASSSVA